MIYKITNNFDKENLEMEKTKNVQLKNKIKMCLVAN